MVETIILSIYAFTALTTLAYMLTSVEATPKIVFVFVLMSIVWPILWLLFIIE